MADVGVTPEIPDLIPQLVEIDRAFVIRGDRTREIDLEQMDEDDYWKLYEEVNMRNDLIEEVEL